MTSSADVNAVLPAAIPKLDAPELDYNVASYAHSQPRVVRILKEDGKQDADIIATDTEMKFVIPAGTYNLAKSVLAYDWETKAVGTGGAHFAWAHMDLLPIQQVILSTREGGYELTKLTFVDQYSRIVPRVETPIDKFLTQDGLDVQHPNMYGSTNYLGESTFTSTPVHDARYYAIAADSKDGKVTVIPPVSKRIELSTFKNSLLAVDKMIYYPEPLELSITFKNRTGWYFEAPSATDASNARDATVDVKLTNVALYMKQESDPTVDRECKNAVLQSPADQPFTIMVPVVTGRRINVAAGADSGFQIQLSSAMGTRLQRVYAIPQYANEDKNTRYTSANLDRATKTTGNRVLSYQTRFNSVNVHPNSISATAKEDYMLNRDLFKGTTIINSNIFYDNWFIVDDYSGITDRVSEMYPPGKHNLVTGKKVQAGDIFEIIANTNPAVVSINWYVFIVGQRVLRIAPLGKGGVGYI